MSRIPSYYFFNLLDSCVDKDVAPAARLDSLPDGTAWYVFHGSKANGLGQQVISEIFVVGVDTDGLMAAKPMPIKDFISKYLCQRLYYRQMTDEELRQLEVLLGPAVDNAINNYMDPKQIEMGSQMQARKDMNLEKLRNWKIARRSGSTCSTLTTVRYTTCRRAVASASCVRYAPSTTRQASM